MGEDLHFELQERVKELSCLYNISKIVQQNEKEMEQLLQEICISIPSGWGKPEMAVARLVYDGREYVSGLIPGGITQSADIIIDNDIRGRVEVHYSAGAGAVFFKEEQQLLDKIALEIAVLGERREKRKKQELLERQLQRNDRLSILGELTAGIAHELNTPVGNILGYAELILRETKNERIKKDLEKIIASAIHAREIIKKLMFFSCEMPAQFEKQDFNKMVRESLRLLRPKFETNRVEIILSLDEGIPLVKFDFIQMTQVIFNLVLNSLHAMPAGGRLNIQTHFHQNNLELIIRDNGNGIPSHLMDKIFQPFFTTKPVGEGTGLGLAVVHGIVKAHSGNIHVASIEGEGTEFKIEFPVNDKQ